MKKLLFLAIVSTLTLTAGAQGLEVRLKGGINIQNSNLSGKEISTLPHFGVSAGVRISTFGIYGELMYSTHEDINGSTTLDYVIPSLQVRFYTYRFMYVEAGVSYAMMSEEFSGGFLENVDKEAGYYVGLGASFRKFELGVRTASLPVTNIQISAAYRF